MISKIQLNDFTIEVTHKKMKNLRLKVYPNGLIKLSAPLHTHPEKIHSFLMSRLDWIQQAQKQLQQRQVETPIHSESDNKIRYVWGTPYSLKVIEQDTCPQNYSHAQRNAAARSTENITRTSASYY
jgi:predicted metal-dependent hydrolase